MEMLLPVAVPVLGFGCSNPPSAHASRRLKDFDPRSFLQGDTRHAPRAGSTGIGGMQTQTCCCLPNMSLFTTVHQLFVPDTPSGSGQRREPNASPPSSLLHLHISLQHRRSLQREWTARKRPSAGTGTLHVKRLGRRSDGIKHSAICTGRTPRKCKPDRPYVETPLLLLTFGDTSQTACNV